MGCGDVMPTDQRGVDTGVPLFMVLYGMILQLWAKKI